MLTIVGLHKTYHRKKQPPLNALQNISLNIGKGMFGLLGPNGAGKSSLMRTIATLQPADSGKVALDGVDVLSNPGFMRANLGYLPQEFGVYNGVSAQDLLHYLAKLKGIYSSQERQRQIDELLEKVNLREHRKGAVSRFSGGMKQRFGIAQALLGNPRVVVVDEPTAGLDPQERNRFHNLLVDVSEHKVVLLSTHIVEDVSNLCTDMAIMSNGCVVCQSSPQELLSHFKNKVWHAYIPKHNLPQIKQQFQVISQRFCAGEVSVHVLSEQQPAANFLSIAPDLEDAYFATLMLNNKHAFESQRKSGVNHD